MKWHTNKNYFLNRNKDILEKVLNGSTYAELGRTYGISGNRVMQIFKKQCRLANREICKSKRGVEFLRENKHLFINK